MKENFKKNSVGELLSFFYEVYFLFNFKNNIL